MQLNDGSKENIAVCVFPFSEERLLQVNISFAVHAETCYHQNCLANFVRKPVY
jgi:hypothetical protein